MIKIMLVEDDKSLREIYGVRLLAEGYEIVSAGDGEEALAMAVKEHPDLILSDVMMPKISGFDMLDILRATPETRDIKVIMMTALSSEDQRARGEALGANRYLVKSQVGIEDVVRTIHEVLSDTPGVATPNNPTFGAPATTPAPSTTQQFSAPAVPAAQTTATAPAPAPVQPAPSAPSVPQQPGVPAGLTPIINPVPTTPQQPTQPIIVPEDVIIPEPVKIAPSGAYHNIQTPSSQLPQPTAPFSTPAPASMGGNVHNNLAQQAGTTPPDFASLMSREISGSAATTQTPNQPTPPQA